MTKNSKTTSTKSAPKTTSKSAPKAPKGAIKTAPWFDMASVGKAAVAAQEKAPKAAPAAQASKVDFSLLSTPNLRKLCKEAKGGMLVAAKAALAARLAVETTKAAQAQEAQELAREAELDVPAPKTKKAPAAAPKAKIEKVRAAIGQAVAREAAAESKAKAEKAPKAAKAPKAEKAKRIVDTNSAVHAPETLEACQGNAPKGSSIHAHFLQFLAHNAASNSEAFVNSLRRPLGEFMDFLKAERVTSWAQLDSKTLMAYRKAAKQTESGEARAVSTTRMSLARVITFLRAQEEGTVNADISLLRVKLTADEKAEAAEAAADAAEDAIEE
jgi:hypothetical protein